MDRGPVAIMRGNIADWNATLRGDIQQLVAADLLAKHLDELYSSAPICMSHERIGAEEVNK